MKKLIFFLVAVSFSCALLAQSGSMENLKWNLSGGTLTISGSGNMPYRKKAENFPWFEYRNKELVSLYRY